MKKYLSLLMAALFVFGTAQAYNATVSWTNPTTNTDGSAIPASGAGSLTSTRVEHGSCVGSAFGTKNGEVVVNQPATSTTITGFAPGYVACFRAYAKNTFGNESGPSIVGTKTMPTPTPNPPVLGATITVAYEILPDRWDGVKLGRNIGTVEKGAPCMGDPIQTNKGEYYEVALDNVKLRKMPKSAIVVTKCAAG